VELRDRCRSSPDSLTGGNTGFSRQWLRRKSAAGPSQLRVNRCRRYPAASPIQLCNSLNRLGFQRATMTYTVAKGISLRPRSRFSHRRRCDLRSDTVTRPSEEMRRAMAVAEVGATFMAKTRLSTSAEACSGNLARKRLSSCPRCMGNLIAIKSGPSWHEVCAKNAATSTLRACLHVPTRGLHAARCSRGMTNP